MDTIFDACVQLLVFLAAQVGMTYKEVNVWIFVIVWPVITVMLVIVIVFQRIRIKRLMNQMVADQKRKQY